MKKYNIKDLTDPTFYHEPIDLSNHSKETLQELLESMVTIRKAEQKLALERKNGLIGGPVHLGVGQEAIAVGTSLNLRKTDRVFGAHRSHSHVLALNPDCYRLFAEVLGKKTGFSKGMGGSMHLWDKPNGFYGSTPIVAGTVPLAVGAAMAAKMNNQDDIGLSYIGDGAVEEGVVHESFNLAKLLDLPILFVIENNLFASHMHISKRQPVAKVSRFASANEIPYHLLDGNDVVAIADTTNHLINEIRSGKGPRLIEFVTFRWYGHVDWREDIDVGVKRSLDDINNWKARDPIGRLSDAMKNVGFLDERYEQEMNDSIHENILEAWEKAVSDPYPDPQSTLDYVFSKRKF